MHFLFYDIQEFFFFVFLTDVMNCDLGSIIVTFLECKKVYSAIIKNKVYIIFNF